MDYDINSQNLLSFAGALYDIVGAFLLASALIFVKARNLYRQATSGFGGFSSPLLKMFAEQKVDAIFGLASLVAGFLLQALASSGFHPTLLSVDGRVLISVLAGILVVGVFLYFVFRHRLIEHFFRVALRSDRSPAPLLTEAEIEERWKNAQQQG